MSDLLIGTLTATEIGNTVENRESEVYRRQGGKTEEKKRTKEHIERKAKKKRLLVRVTPHVTSLGEIKTVRTEVDSTALSCCPEITCQHFTPVL